MRDVTGVFDRLIASVATVEPKLLPLPDYAKGKIKLDKKVKPVKVKKPVDIAAVEKALQKYDLGQIYLETKGKMFGKALRLTKRIEDAEDFVQQTFLIALEKLNSFRGDSKVSSWMFKIMTNEIYMHFRTAYYQSEKYNAGSSGNSYDASGDPLEKTYESDPGDALELAEAIMSLSKGYRNIFILYEIFHFSHEEIAAKFNIEVGTSKSQLHKAKQRLRELLSDYAPARLRKATEAFSTISTASNISEEERRDMFDSESLSSEDFYDLAELPKSQELIDTTVHTPKDEVYPAEAWPGFKKNLTYVY